MWGGGATWPAGKLHETGDTAPDRNARSPCLSGIHSDPSIIAAFACWSHFHNQLGFVLSFEHSAFKPASMPSVFVYGTLMAEEVCDALLERPHNRFPAKLSGYKRHRIRQQVFPAIIPASQTDTILGWVSPFRLHSCNYKC